MMTEAISVAEQIDDNAARLFRYLNDNWIFTKLMRPHLLEEAGMLLDSTERKKTNYPVPRQGRAVFSVRSDYEIGQLFQAQFDRGVFEANIVNIVSRVEAFKVPTVCARHIGRN
jgi:hypothetical protein